MPIVILVDAIWYSYIMLVCVFLYTDGYVLIAKYIDGYVTLRQIKKALTL